MRMVAPPPGSQHRIASDTTPPRIRFTTDATGPHDWEWQISWRTFRRNGRARTPGNSWDLQNEIAHLGGTLRVVARAGMQAASATVTVIGTNPSEAEVTAFLRTQPNSDGYLDILRHESHLRHFNRTGQPIVSFDNGYGMSQLTNPAPTYEQAWSWQRNIVGGLALFAQKRREALAYLSQGGRSYTNDQLRREIFSRWNGGAYHRWNATAGEWQRNPDILCDPNTGNIGWNMTDADNAGRTLQQLRARDSASFARGRRQGDNWAYYGVCYADRLAP